MTLPDGGSTQLRLWDTTPTPLHLALARAHRWLAMLEAGEASSMKEVARREGVDDSYVSRMVNVTTPAPDIVAAILGDTLTSGCQPSPDFSPGGGRTTYCIESSGNSVDPEKTVCFREVPILALAGCRARTGSRERSPNGEGARGRRLLFTQVIATAVSLRGVEEGPAAQR
jgi:hypothetical protein